MPVNLRGRHLLSLRHHSDAEIHQLLWTKRVSDPVISRFRRTRVPVNWLSLMKRPATLAP